MQVKSAYGLRFYLIVCLSNISFQLDYAKRQLHYDTEPKDYRRNRSATLATSDPIQNMEHIHLNGSSAFHHHDQMPLKVELVFVCKILCLIELNKSCNQNKT